MEAIIDETEATEYPLATDGLHKGSRVAAEVIEHAFGVVRGSKEYQLAALQATQYITRRLDERGEAVTVVQSGDEIAILTDEEASAYNARRFQQTRRAGERAFKRLRDVNRANLSEDIKREHDRNVVVIGRCIQADRAARREVTPKALPRATPARRRANR